MKRVSAWLLLIVMIVPFLLFAGCQSTTVDETWNIPDLSGLERREPNMGKSIERSGVKYYLVEENDSYALYINTVLYDVALVEKSSGETWYSNPSEETIAASGNNSELYAQLHLTWLDKKKGSQSYYNSYENAVVPNQEDSQNKVTEQVIMTNGRDGAFRVLYVLGRLQKDYVIPKVLDEATYEAMKEVFVANGGNVFQLQNNFVKLDKATLDGANPNVKKNYYDIAPALVNIKAEDGVIYLLTSQIWKTSTAAPVEAALKECGMTQELRLELDEKWQVPEQTNNAFIVPLDYKLEADGLKVSVPAEDINFNEALYAINSLQVLRYFGAADTSETGYMVVPDGSGALINFNNGKIALSSGVSVQMYGMDRGKTLSTSVVSNKTEQGYLPIWGIKKENSSLFAVIEKGAAVATISADIPKSAKNRINYVASAYKLTEYEDMQLFAEQTTLRAYQPERVKSDISIKYSVLADKEHHGYEDMAKYYREYLINRGMLQKAGEQTDVPFNVELFGAMTDSSAFLGVQYQYLNALTTFEQAQEILSKLIDGGVKNISVRYRGMSNNGLLNSIYNSMNLLGELGGTAKYKQLMQYAEENSIKIYPEAELLRVYKDVLFDGFLKFTDGGRTIGKTDIMYYQYDLMQPSSYVHQAYILDPPKAQSVAENLIKSLNSQNIKNVSLGSIGNMLTGDYDVDKPQDRTEVEAIYSNIMQRFKEAEIDTAVVGGNVYALAAATNVFCLPSGSSGYYLVDETIPFYQIVLHGLVPYSSEVINQTGDETRSILQAVEYGAGLAYRWMYAENKSLQTVYFEEAYSLSYESSISDAIKVYDRYNSEMGHTAGLMIVGHARLAEDVAMTQYEDGTVVYVNYGGSDYVHEGVTVPARDYTVVKGGRV